MRAGTLAVLAAAVAAHCPNFCNGHGRCAGVGRCECYGMWGGGDCSQRKCPQSNAWADVAIGDDIAHQPATCSNRGTCNTGSGQCDCMPGYGGKACNRMECPDKCSGRGQCLSMRQYAGKLDKGLQTPPYYSYGLNWDADMVYGCACDEQYGGYNCGERLCPRGDDPMTTRQVDETQVIRCDLPGATTTPTFTISYRGASTAPFAPSIRADELKSLLQALPTIGIVDVVYSRGFTFCSDEYSPSVPASGNVVGVSFVTQHGDVPSLVVQDAKGAQLSGLLDNMVTLAVDGAGLTYALPTGTGVATSVTGTKESIPCSGRGACDTVTGTCACYRGYASSDGRGRPGTEGDCGYVTLPIASCPGAPECSGHGVCSGSPQYKCTCHEGWQGGDCSERVCPTGVSWFDYPTAANVAHAPRAECSSRGSCDRDTGTCTCQPAFEGEACERMKCPGTNPATGQVCSVHGRCLSMSQLAAFATDNGDATPYTYGADPNNRATWDGSSVYGCLCDEGYTGFDCAQRTCPFGTDITLFEESATSLNEVQKLNCRLVSASGAPKFRLRFRQAETDYIAPTASAAVIAAALAALEPAGTVLVDLNGAVGACTAGAGTDITFTFKTVGGDVPPIQVVMDEGSANPDGTFNAGDGWMDTQLEFTGGDPLTSYATSYTYVKGPSTGYVATGVRALEVRKGTSGYAECSDRGICNRETGTCSCFHGFGASNGDRGEGYKEDCGWREQIQYVPHLKGADGRSRYAAGYAPEFAAGGAPRDTDGDGAWWQRRDGSLRRRGASGAA